ncbi:MAG: YgiT-type zinc finger protein [Caldilineaceae bacterium]
MRTELQIKHCPNCGSDQIKKVRRNWVGKSKGKSYTVPDLEFYECPICQERIFDLEALRQMQVHSPAFAKRKKERSKTKETAPVVTVV